MISRFFAMCLFAIPLASIRAFAIDLDSTVWNTNWNVMFFWQNGNQVSGEYMYDDGVLTGTLYGDTLKGWWREAGNTKECGPGNAWSGALLFLFNAAGTSFTGSWNSCPGTGVLDPNATSWTGTIKDGYSSYTQQECESGGRYWCGGECRITPCDSAMNQGRCEASGWFWCDGTCKVTSCNETSVRDFSARHIDNRQDQALNRHPARDGELIDMRGTVIRTSPAAGVYIRRSSPANGIITMQRIFCRK